MGAVCHGVWPLRCGLPTRSWTRTKRRRPWRPILRPCASQAVSGPYWNALNAATESCALDPRIWPGAVTEALTDAHRSEPIDHPWCAIRRSVPPLAGVYTALLFMPKEFPETPAPAMLCPHGHWDHNHAHPDVQTRLLTFARMGYVVLSPRQNHHEDLLLGLSHQTLMIWTNMRGIDFLQSLPEVDPERIGAAGASGGGLQTQMVTALDDRIKAATIVGLTCDYREILFPHAAHCACNHWPNLMAYTDSPEISALAFPRPVQYLVMNDWTRHFPHDNFPTILELFHQNGFPDRVSCTYWPTGHTYDRDKRERTYWWMERWLRNAGNHQTPIPAEPGDIVTVFPPQMLDEWPVKNPENKGFDALAALFHARYHHAKQPRPDPDGLKEYAVKMKAALPGLLGLENGLKPEANGVTVLSARNRRAIVSQVEFPSEGYLRLPARVFRRGRVLRAMARHSLLVQRRSDRARKRRPICRPRETRQCRGGAGCAFLRCL